MEEWNQTDRTLEAEEQETEQERERRRRRRQRIEQMRREKRRAQLVQKLVPPVLAGILLILVIGFAVGRVHRGASDTGRSGTAVAEKEVSQAGSTQAPQAGSTAEPEAGSKQAPQTGSTAEPEAGSTQAPQTGNTAEPQAGSTAEPETGSAQAPQTGNTAEPQAGSTAEPQAGSTAEPQAGSTAEPQTVTTGGEVFGPFPTEKPQLPVFSATATAQTHGFGDEIVSQYGILIDVAQGEIIAQKDAGVRMNPASMTKVLTVLTAAEALGLTGEDWEEKGVLDDKFTITIEITDYSYVHDCSNVGFEVGEEVTVRDLFYGTILPSGGDAALGLACYVAGSQEAFVEKMNEKLAGLGLSGTSHFTNCVGLYDEEHYCTAYDMAVMLKTAADSPFCRQVLSAHTYTTTPTEQHPEGLLISNWFLRRIEDKDTHGEVICGKTGYVVQSGSCAASLAADAFGKEYVCVTAASSSSWQCIYDQTALFQRYLDSGQSAALP